MSWKTRLITWLDHRTGVETAVRNFLYEKIPDSSGWRQGRCSTLTVGR